MRQNISRLGYQNVPGKKKVVLGERALATFEAALAVLVRLAGGGGFAD